MSTEKKPQPYYLYTNGVLKLVDREEPDYEKYYMGGAIDRATSCEVDRYADKEYEADRNNWLNHVASLPSIAVSSKLKEVWNEGYRPTEGQDFELQFWTGAIWCPIEHLVDRKPKPGTKLKAFGILNRANTMQEGKQEERTFTLKEALEIWDGARLKTDKTDPPILVWSRKGFFKERFNIDIT